MERTWLDIVPWGVEVAERDDLVADADLYPAEELAAVSHVPRRRAEFATGRRCAREALYRLGVRAASSLAIPVGATREPLWPPGVVGSISHCDGRCVAAVGRHDRYESIGIDVEVRTHLSATTIELTSRPDDVVCNGGDLAVELPIVLFSAREAIYKCWFPFTGQWLGHHDVRLVLDGAGRTFTVAAATAMATDWRRWLASMRGAFTWTADHVYTVAWVNRQPPPTRAAGRDGFLRAPEDVRSAGP